VTGHPRWGGLPSSATGEREWQVQKKERQEYSKTGKRAAENLFRRCFLRKTREKKVIWAEKWNGPVDRLLHKKKKKVRRKERKKRVS